MFQYPYIIELLSPKTISGAELDRFLDRFAERYKMAMDVGCTISVPDNPMGQLRMGALETFSQRGIKIDPEKVVMNLNTFHTKNELDSLLHMAAKTNLKYILVVKGDGGPLLSKLDPKSVGGKMNVATSMDLLSYINSAFPDQFITGTVFNPYKPMPFELNRMTQKIDAGAKFVITQPIIGRDEHVDRLREFDIDVIVEAWMSTNIDLFYKSVGKKKSEGEENYDPIENLKNLHRAYPDNCIYLSMLSFKEDWRKQLPAL